MSDFIQKIWAWVSNNRPMIFACLVCFLVGCVVGSKL